MGFRFKVLSKPDKVKPGEVFSVTVGCENDYPESVGRIKVSFFTNYGEQIWNFYPKTSRVITLKFRAPNVSGYATLRASYRAIGSYGFLESGSFSVRVYVETGPAPTPPVEKYGYIYVKAKVEKPPHGYEYVHFPVYIDGNYVGETPIEVKVPVGKHSVKVKSYGDVEPRYKSTTVYVDEGETEYYTAVFRYPTGKLVIRSNVDISEIYVDGRRYNSTEISLVEGSYHVKVVPSYKFYGIECRDAITPKVYEEDVYVRKYTTTYVDANFTFVKGFLMVRARYKDWNGIRYVKVPFEANGIRGNTESVLCIDPGTYNVIIYGKDNWYPNKYEDKVEVVAGKLSEINGYFELDEGEVTIRTYLENQEVSLPISINGNIVKTPVTLRLRTGSYKVSIDLEHTPYYWDYYSKDVEFAVERLKSKEVKIVLEKRPKYASVTVKSYVDGEEVSGFDVYVNGYVGKTPVTFKIEKGNYVVRVIAGEDYEPKEDKKELKVLGGEEYLLEFRFKRIAPKKAPKPEIPKPEIRRVPWYYYLPIWIGIGYVLYRVIR